MIVTDLELTADGQNEGLTIIQVDSLKESYWKFITDYRAAINIPVIAVTGTSGKTTTKEMIRHLLSINRKIAYSNSTNNSRTAHLTHLLMMDDTTEAAVFETAVGAPGDITNAAAYLKPTIGIITNIGEHHLNYCKTLEGYIAAKGEMCTVLQQDGVLIINADDSNTQKLDLTKFWRKAYQSRNPFRKRFQSERYLFFFRRDVYDSRTSEKEIQNAHSWAR